MKKRREGMKGFFAGVLTTLLVLGLMVPALALSSPQTIQCYMGGIKIFIDGQLQVPTDAYGNVVEPLAYNGTTYLPIRALTGMLTDKAVEWDSDTESIYIGLKPGAGEVIQIQDLEAYKGAGASTGSGAQFQLMGETQSPFNLLYGTRANNYQHSTTYILNEQYTSLQGMAAVESAAISTAAGSVKVYSVDRNNNETLLKEYSPTAGAAPIPVSVNLRGCYAIRIETGYSITNGNSDHGLFYNVTITKATAG